MTPKSIFVRGYEIPVATRSELRSYGLWIGIPALAVVLSILFTHSAGRATAVWLLIAVGVFHLRNVVVRKEADAGLHDDLYGPYLMRMQQREFDNRLRWFRKVHVAFGGTGNRRRCGSVCSRHQRCRDGGKIGPVCRNEVTGESA